LIAHSFCRKTSLPKIPPTTKAFLLATPSRGLDLTARLADLQSRPKKSASNGLAEGATSAVSKLLDHSLF
jgi:hypothetical protein